MRRLIRQFCSAVVIVAVSSFISQSATAFTYHQIYVLNGKGRSIVVFPDSKSGNLAPQRTIAGSRTMITTPVSFAIDDMGRIYVLNKAPAAVLEFAASANGNVSPQSVLQGSKTGLEDPVAIAIGVDGVLFVADSRTGISMFARSASGDEAPTRILGPRAGVPIGLTGMGVDQLGEVYYTTREADAVTAIYAMPKNGIVQSYRIAGTQTGIKNPTALSVDRFGRIYLSNGDNSSLLFEGGARGNVAPYISLRGSNTLLSRPAMSGFDTAACIFTPNRGNNTVVEFDPATSGNARPTLVYRGNKTKLDDPISVVYW